MANYINGDFRPAQYNIQIWENDTWNNTFTLLNDTTPISLVGATIEIQIRKTLNSTNPSLTLTLGDGITIGGTNNNVITIDKQIVLDGGSYVYDMPILFSDGTEKTYIWGQFIVYKDVTKL